MATCTVDGCARPSRSRGWCAMHYHRWYRNGDLHTLKPRRKPTLKPGQRFGTLTIVEWTGSAWLCQCDCGKTRTTWAGDLNRAGDNSTCGDRTAHRRSDNISYFTAHDRVTRDRGRSSTHSCVDCGSTARQWSYTHADPDELVGQVGKSEAAYSVNPDYYEPRCVPCHKRYDLGRIDAARIN